MSNSTKLLFDFWEGVLGRLKVRLPHQKPMPKASPSKGAVSLYSGFSVVTDLSGVFCYSLLCNDLIVV